MIRTNFFTKEQIDEIDSKLYHKGSIIRDPAHKCEITKLWEAIHSVLITNGTAYIGEDGYWYIDGERTEVKAQGEQGIPGEPGKDGIAPTLRVSNDGMSLEISNDGGQTWSPFIKDFNKLRVIGYLDSTDKLPKNALIGDIYGVWNKDADNSVTGTKGAYELYINTILDWLLDYEITKVYSYDTELPSSATDGTTVLVPVSDLTLNKEKVDGYKVYKFSQANNGWIMVLNTAEIYAGKDDIINYGDNAYALVQGDEPNTYQLYKRQVGWVYFGTNASITYKLVQNVSEGAENNVLSGKAVKDAVDKINSDVASNNEELNKRIDDINAAVKETYGDYEDNPEFVRVYLDNDGHILWGVQADGNVYFGAGVPQQVKDYINAKLGEIWGVADITEKIDSLKEVIDFLETYKNSDSLQKLLAEQDTKIDAVSKQAEQLGEDKVNKEEGKSLIDAEFAEGISYEENPEFASVLLDAGGRILEATRNDGTKVLPAGTDIQGVVIETIDNPEWAMVYLIGDRIAFGIKKDGSIDWGYGVPTPIKDYVEGKLNGFDDLTEIIDTVKEMTDFLEGYVRGDKLSEILDKKVDGEYIENPEFVKVVTDTEGKVLSGTKRDGSHYIHNVESETIPTAFSEIEDVEERSEMTTDADGKILSYRRKDGTKVEHSLEVEHFSLTPKGMAEFHKELKDSGFQPGGHGDWSSYISNDGDNPLHLPMPSCASLNIITDFNLLNLNKIGFAGAIDGVNYNVPVVIEYFDKGGNYFKKNAIISAQGKSSMGDEKKNIAIDIFDDESMDGAFSVKFGTWVSQDSFHLKAYQSDALRCLGVIGYKLFNQIVETRGVFNDYQWKKGLLNLNAISDKSIGTESIKEEKNQLETGARCFPDGFPVVVYHNGEFWGIFSWQLKKHRDNLHLDKNNGQHVYLDGFILDVFDYNGNLDWDVISGRKVASTGTLEPFEIRNPKTLYLMDGSKYNADTNLGELIDSTSPAYDESKHSTTAAVKNHIKDFSCIKTKIDTAYDEYIADKNESNLNSFKNTFEKYLDVDCLIDYIIFSDITLNLDGWGFNWQWFTYDGVKWYVQVYDLDRTFGHGWGELYGAEEQSAHHNGNKKFFTHEIIECYGDKINARYKELRDKKIIDADNIVNILRNWINSIGSDVYKKEYDKWGITSLYDSVFRVYLWVKNRIQMIDSTYNYN